METFFALVRRYAAGMLIIAALGMVLVIFEMTKHDGPARKEIAAASQNLAVEDVIVRKAAAQLVVARFLFGKQSFRVRMAPEVGLEVLVPAPQGEPLPEMATRMAAMRVARAWYPPVDPRELGARPDLMVSIEGLQHCAYRILDANVALVVQTAKAIRAHLEEGTPLPVMPDPLAPQFNPLVEPEISFFCHRPRPAASTQ